MLPYAAASGVLSTITRSGSEVPQELQSIKGVFYQQFPALSGNYVATYTTSASPPAITHRTPAPGATGIALNSPITVKFNQPMTPSSISAQGIELRDGAGALVPASVSYAAATAAVTLSPPAGLAPGTTYTVKVKDAGWSFTTLAAPTCPCSAWDPAFVPANTDSTDAGSVELGVKFRSDVGGQVTGVRFYKSAANAGPHVGNLWSSSGQLLGTVTFANETASGWQQANFPAPIAIAANTVYVISYFAPKGNYAYANGFFTSAGVDRPPIHILRDGESGSNGVYAYGSSSFPSSTYRASNYFVDVVFNTTVSGPAAPVTVAPPTVAPAPVAGATAGNGRALSIWSAAAAPSVASSSDTEAVELGVKFRSDVNGVVTGVRFYKGTANAGAHVGNLWSESGQLLASVKFTGETASGWQQATFATPVAVSANTVYVASYFAPKGRYAADSGYFASTGTDNGPLHALPSGVSGPNGVYVYGTSSTFPGNNFQSTNYWVDVLFAPGM
jgi:hypothetical protein